ncbi:MAG: hypothetical protein ABIQ62_04730 [Thermomonas sp.]
MSDGPTAAQAPRLWVGGDGCPGPIKDILFRAAKRTRVAVILVDNPAGRAGHFPSSYR